MTTPAQTTTPSVIARAPTPQGTFDHTPPGTVSRMAAKAGTSPDRLATVSLTSASCDPYMAVMEYATLYAQLEKTVDDKFRPLLVEHNYHDMPSASLGDDSDAEDYDNDEPPAVEEKAQACAPTFLLDLGESEILWPPMPELTAARLLEERNAVGRKRARGKGASGAAQKKARLDGCAKGEVVTPSDNANGNLQEDDSAVERNVIYLAHYALGEPQDSNVFRHLLLGSPDGSEALRKFVKEAIQWRMDKNHREVDGNSFTLKRFKTSGDGNYWADEGLKHARPSATVVLADGQLEMIMEDVRRFLRPKCKKWYTSRGLPHRRSYMFYGEPGTGKTSTIRAIASKFRLDCCFLSVTNKNFSNQHLCDALSEIPQNALLVLEDVDALFNEDRKAEDGASLTFSGMLNALDGVVSVDGVVTVMTTNHIDRLDKALIRGGRVDRRFYFGLPTEKQVAELFLNFYPHCDVELGEKFASAVFAEGEREELRSIPTLQQLFIQHRESSAEECVAGLDAFCKTHFPAGAGKDKSNNDS